MNPREYITQGNALYNFQPISFTFQHATNALLTAIFIYAFGMLLAYLLSRVGVEDQICLALVHASGAAALLIFWKFGRWGRAKYDSFGSALLLVSSGFKVHALLDTLIFGARLENIYKYTNVPLPDPAFYWLLKGELITVIGLLLIACSWRLMLGREVERQSFSRTVQTVPIRISIFVYLVALCIDILKRIFDLSFGALEQFFHLFFIAGVAAIYFISSRRKTSLGKVLLAILMGFPMSMLAMNSGMKEQMLFPFIPGVILYWINYSKFLARLLLVCAAIIVLSVSQLYVFVVRDLAWGPTGDFDIPTSVLISSFMENIDNFQPIDAFDLISSRVNMTASHAITVTLADNNGYEPEEVFGLIPASVIPRILWPEKPVMQPGAMHTARITGVSGPISDIQSATAAGFATELYLGGWWVGVMLGAVLFGLILAVVQKWVVRFGNGFGHQTLCFITFYWTLRFDEKHVVYAYTTILFVTVFILGLVSITKLCGFRQNLKPI